MTTPAQAPAAEARAREMLDCFRSAVMTVDPVLDRAVREVAALIAERDEHLLHIGELDAENVELRADRDAQAALVGRLREALARCVSEGLTHEHQLIPSDALRLSLQIAVSVLAASPAPAPQEPKG